MKATMLLVAGVLGLGVMAGAPVQAGTANPAKAERRAEVKDELKELRADVEAVRTAHQAKDKAAVQTALAKLKTDWEALPPEAKKRIEENHPALFKALKERLEKHGKLANA